MHGTASMGKVIMEGRDIWCIDHKQREALPDSVFAIPEERKYPIHDKNHARAALARVTEFGTPEENSG